MSVNEKRASRPISDDELLAKAIPIESDADDSADDGGGKQAVPQPVADEDELAPIEIDSDVEEHADEEAARRRAASKIRTFGSDSAQRHEDHWNRTPNVTGRGAIHVKTFCAKLRLDAIEHLDEQINEWLDSHPEYEVKFATTSIGPLVGKLTEDALFVNVWV